MNSFVKKIKNSNQLNQVLWLLPFHLSICSPRVNSKSCKHTLWAKTKNIPKIELTVNLGVLKICLEDFACLYFHQFQTACECFVEINRINTNYYHFKV